MSPANSCAWGVFQGAITQTLLSVKLQSIVLMPIDQRIRLELGPCERG